MALLLHCFICTLVGVTTSLLGIGWFNQDGFNFFGALLNILLVIGSVYLLERGFYQDVIDGLKPPKEMDEE